MLLTNDNIDFKKVNKNLKQELSKMGFDISNQSCLNLLSRSLGYNNYNTYKALSNEAFEEQGINLESIFNILKTVTLDDFYKPSGYKRKFIYKEDSNLAIIEDDYEDKEKVYGYDFFFDRDRNEIELSLPYDKLVKKICQYKDLSVTCQHIKVDKWTVLYNNVEIYYIDTLTISNPSSLYATLPLSIDTFDFIYNLCDIVNEDRDAIKRPFIKSDLLEALNIQDSSFQDFISYR